jgi:tetratricopeptide (TPR) repeat protein
VPAVAARQAYSREDVRRVLGVSERQLRSWESQGLLPASESYSFSDLRALRTLMRLRESKISPARIREAVNALREKLRDVGNPLVEVKLYLQGKRIHVQLAGQRMEAVSGQLLFNFDHAEIKRLLAFPGEENGVAAAKRRKREAEVWFEKGLELEQAGAPVEEIVSAYQKAAEIDPASSGALVNLGTVYFNARAWREAEREYRKAIEIDPNYALAHFNLANLFDERGDRAKALFHYQAALRIHPSYADAHYNIALLYQATNQPLKAVGHWRTYLRLDPRSSWAEIARRELEKIRGATIVRGEKA